MTTQMRRVMAGMVLLAVGGCVSMPSGPSVMVLPAPGKSFEQFQVDDGICRQWAGRQLGLPPQDTATQDIGGGVDQVSDWEAQRRYDIAYQQCMYAKGNQLPGTTVTRTRRVQTPPPPPPVRLGPGPPQPDVPPDYTGN